MRLDDGSTRPGRLFAFPRGRGYVAVTPAGRGLRRLELRDRTGRLLTSFRTRVPPAARQCGYDFDVFPAA
jgi:hypothetical protein